MDEDNKRTENKEQPFAGKTEEKQKATIRKIPRLTERPARRDTDAEQKKIVSDVSPQKGTSRFLKQEAGAPKREGRVQKREAGASKREAGALKREAGVLKREAGVPKQEAGDSKREVGAQKQETRQRLTGDRTRRTADMDLNEGKLSDVSRRRRERENETKMQLLMLVLGVLTVLLVAAILYEIVLGHGTKMTGAERMAAADRQKQQTENIIVENENDTKEEEGDANQAVSPEEGQEQDTAAGETEDNGETQQSAEPTSDLKQQADRMAMQYDYDGAIELLTNTEGYGENTEYQTAVSGYEQQKAACVPFPAEEVTHIFFHTLIHDPAKAFDGDEYESGYNQFMVTENEFNSIMEQMYERGYVLVFLSDIVSCTEDENGNKTFAPKDIMLPEGKIPFVLSQDDVSYYHYMDGDGYASRLIVDENGDVRNEYIEDDGSISVGDYDMVPLVDRFVEKHPDFSYHGAKGYVALTGYEGILGYRTDEVYKTKEASRVTPQQQMFFDSYPGGFDEAAYEKECEGARQVADAMKKNGWKFASHTWGHQNLSETNGISYESFVRDTDRWETWVEPLIGETDTLIYAFGGDIRGWEKYSGDRYNYLKQCGFDYFCGVDSAKYWLQIEPGYVRQSRRNVDGYRMYYNPDMLSDLFDVQKAWDPMRPSYVPEI
ncbi:MAG: polysaccharide deacetylase family protein [Candidatus Choladocola sp.]|nr:polysaccharide deacetylase family protein [Candidatus Choladocola sp.]